MTINCDPLNTASWARCVTTTLYNNEDADDKSIISSTIVTQQSTVHESSLYPVIFTAPGLAAAAAAATPQDTLAPSTTATLPPTTPTTSPTAAPSPTHPPPALTPGAKAGLGVGVPLGVLALAGLGLLLLRGHVKHREHARLSQTEHLVALPAGGEVSEYGAAGKGGGGDAPAADVGGVYEMQGRRSSVRSVELEA